MALSQPVPHGAPSDGARAVPLPLPTTLTPSKISAFTSCPLAFRYSVIERLPEPPSLPAVRGTLVHRALQHLFTYTDATGRTRERAEESLAATFAAHGDDPEVVGLGLDDAGLAQLRREASTLLDRYFELEDPTTVRPAGLEIDLQAELDGLQLRGIVDRLDVLDDGSFAIVDYKTGRAPRSDQAKSKLFGVQLYALLCEAVIGQRPSAVRLLYLRDRVVVSSEPNDMSIRAVRQRAGAVWTAIERACASGDFRPSPSGLCSWCSFQRLCPAQGGDPDAAR